MTADWHCSSGVVGLVLWQSHGEVDVAINIPVIRNEVDNWCVLPLGGGNVMELHA